MFQRNSMMVNIFSTAFRSTLYSLMAVATVSFVTLYPNISARALEISDISPEIFKCMKEHNSNERGYLSFPNGNSGTINAYADILDMWGGSVDFTYNPTEHILTVTNPQGPGGEQIQEGLRDVATKCINGEFE